MDDITKFAQQLGLSGEQDPIAEEACLNCRKSAISLNQPLKRCGNCRVAMYCSQDCQKANWKSHKRQCASSTQKQAKQGPSQGQKGEFNATLSGLMQAADGKYLHGLSEDDAYSAIIDSYRLRVEDDYVYGQGVSGLYADEDPFPDFQEYLSLAEERGVMPPWWNTEKRRECERRSNGADWSNIFYAVEKSDIIDHYKDSLMPMKLRMVAEKVYGTRVGT
ncbi:zinc finger, MYND-type [Lipomyces kononenkoae]|uniref:Zinc finger, MYND-type n=1 Tax=Lipomyces kononenkoae TaxID=34357 RepID=A0ACC3SUT1_LIPKO